MAELAGRQAVLAGVCSIVEISAAASAEVYALLSAGLVTDVCR